MKAIITGSFDPVTIGHEALVKKATRAFDDVLVLLCQNFAKNSLFSADERLALLRETFKDDERVRVDYHEGWLYEYLKCSPDSVLFKGVRDYKDFEYEKEMARFNYEKSGVDTIIVYSEGEFDSVSSTKVRELLQSGGDWKKLVPQNAQKLIENFYRNI